MRLALKIISAVLLIFVVLLLLDGYLTIQRETRIYYQDMQQTAQLLGLVTRVLVTETWKQDGEEKALAMLERINSQEQPLVIRWVWLDVPQQHVYAPKAKPEQLKPLREGNPVFLHPETRTQRHMLAYIPVQTAVLRPGGLEISIPVSTLHAHTRRIVVRTVILIGSVILLDSLLLIWIGIRMIGQPLSRLMDKTRRIGEGDFSDTLEATGRDELTQLARAVNRMGRQIESAQERIRTESAARIATLEQLRHTERLATLGRLSSGVAHELGTPLNIISGRAKMVAQQDMEKAEINANVSIIHEQSERMAWIIKQLLEFARRRTPHKTLMDLKMLAKQVLDMLTPIAKKHQVELTGSVLSELPAVRMDPLQIQQVIANIIMNGIQAMTDGGTLRVELFPARVEGRDYAALAVHDQGSGIADDHLPHIFDPFFTTKEVGQGTGLGLSIAYGIMQDHGGWIDVKSEFGKGSCFTVYLPLEVPEQAEPAATECAGSEDGIELKVRSNKDLV